MLKLSLVAAVFLAACAHDAPPTGPEAPAMPAGKTNEAWGFDMRLNFDEGVLDGLGPNYYWAIRDAALRWERIVYASHEASHIYDMSQTTRGLTLEHSSTGKQIIIRNQRAYLDWSDWEIFIAIDDDIQEPSDDEFYTWAYATSWFIDDKLIPVSAIFIPHYMLEDIEEGAYDPDAFYSDMVHEIGHILGFNEALQKKRLVSRSGSSWSYRGKNGVEAFKRITNKTGAIPMVDPGHFDGFNTKWSRYWDVMFQYFAGLNPRKGLISEVSVGVLDDLGYWVNYREADDTRMSWRYDPRNPNWSGHHAAKPVAGHHQWHCVPPRVGLVRPLDTDAHR